MARKLHWEKIYRERSPLEVSWYQTHPSLSIELIHNTGISKDAAVIDIGGGASMLVDRLLDEEFSDLSVMDISAAAIDHAKNRLGERADSVKWYEADITRFIPPARFDLWHDRAVFHFLTDEEDRRRYSAVLRDTVAPGGHIIIATFAMDGPKRCSGLDIVQYDAESICPEVGGEYELVEVQNETHHTPAGMEQRFIYFRFTRK